jgi:hypothetical protein
MYIRVTTGQADPSRAGEISTWANERLVPLLRTLPGFKEYHGGADPQTGRVLAVSLWDTREQAAGLREAAGSVLAELNAMGVTLDAPQVFEQTVSS